MNFEELCLSALNKADEEPGDEIIDKVVEDAINHGYRTVATLVDKLMEQVELNYSDKIQLPDDFYAVVKLIHNNTSIQLSPNDYYISGNYLFITNKRFKTDDSTFTLLYIYFPDKLVELTDEPLTREEYDYIIILYGAYSVLLYKKRYDMASRLYNEYISHVSSESGE